MRRVLFAITIPALLAGCGASSTQSEAQVKPVALARLEQAEPASTVSNVNVSLAAGWNGVGFQCQQLSSLSANPSIAGLATWNGTSFVTGNFATSDINAGAGGRRGFWIFATGATSFTYSGQDDSARFVDLVTGYNLVSFQTNADLPGNTLVATQGGQVVPLGSVVLPTFFEIQPLTNQYVSVDVSAGGTLKPGRAYWVFASGNVRLSVSGTSPSPGASPLPGASPSPAATPTPTPVPPPTSPGKLYVLTGSKSIRRFNGASTLNGAVSPSATITQGLTGGFVMDLDLANDRLYVGDDTSSQVLVYNNISTRGNTPPDRTIKVSGVDSFFGIAIDPVHDVLYVTSVSSSNFVYRVSGASSASGTVNPTSFTNPELVGGQLALANAQAFNSLYVSDTGLRAFTNPSTLAGNSPMATIASSIPALDLAADNSNRCVATRFSTTLQARPVTGGNSLDLTVPSAAETLAPDANRNQMYVLLGDGSVAVYHDFTSLSGTTSVAPNRRLTFTGFTPVDVQVDPLR